MIRAHNRTVDIPLEAITAFKQAIHDVPGWPPYLARSADHPDLPSLREADREAEEMTDAVVRRVLETVAPMLVLGIHAEHDRRVAAAERDRIALRLTERGQEIMQGGSGCGADAEALWQFARDLQ